MKSSRSTTPSAKSQPPGSNILATSQTSRFHVDTLTTLATDLDLKQVNISIGNLDLLVDVDLKLKPGIHYALTGRNGEGKSTLLKAIAEKIIPGIPENLRILLVDQVEGHQAILLTVDDEGGVASDMTVVQRVIKSDRLRERTLKEAAILTKAMEGDGQTTQTVTQAVTTVLFSRSQYILKEAQKTALKRSGARGADARKALLKAEALVVESEERLQASLATRTDDPASVEKANSLIAEIQGTLDVMDSDSTDAQARSILLGLGFAKEQIDAKFSTLSGGWRSRCALASALLQKPDILLCDEPNNYCDLPAVLWLQDYITSLTSTTVVVISHDRDFLDAISEEVIILRQKKLHYFDGNPSEYERFSLQKRKGLIKMKEAQDRKKEAFEKSIETGIKSARKTGDDNRLRMAKSRQKKLDERWGMERSDKGHRFKVNRDLGYYHTSFRNAIEIDELDPPVTFYFESPEPMRFPGALISATNLSFRYTASSPLILEDVTLTIHPGTRTALLGRNGQGKSTLLKLLIGNLPSKAVDRHTRLRFGYFDQLSVEVLSEEPNVSKPLVEFFKDTMMSTYSIEVDEPTVRSVLGRFGLGHRSTSPVGVLSGGQKVRLALSLLAFYSPDLLVLDEVSTHLDMDSIIGLIRALRGYSGAILLVSHDRFLVRTLVEGAPLFEKGDDEDEDENGDDDDGDDDDAEVGEPGRVYVVEKKKIRLLEGGSNQYTHLVEKRMKRRKG